MPHGNSKYFSCKILGFEVINNTLNTEFCLRCLLRCINKYVTPAIFNIDHGV